MLRLLKLFPSWSSLCWCIENSHGWSNVYDTFTKPISADVEACATVGPGQLRVLLRKPSRKRSLWLLGKGSSMAQQCAMAWIDYWLSCKWWFLTQDPSYKAGFQGAQGWERKSELYFFENDHVEGNDNNHVDISMIFIGEGGGVGRRRGVRLPMCWDFTKPLQRTLWWGLYFALLFLYLQVAIFVFCIGTFVFAGCQFVFVLIFDLHLWCIGVWLQMCWDFTKLLQRIFWWGLYLITFWFRIMYLSACIFVFALMVYWSVIAFLLTSLRACVAKDFLMGWRQCIVGWMLQSLSNIFFVFGRRNYPSL